MNTATDTQEPATYVDDNGEEKREHRRKARDDDDPRIDHLFSGFDSLILTAKANDHQYQVGYVTSMREEFGQLISSLVR